jgi:hypothetical protein
MFEKNGTPGFAFPDQARQAAGFRERCFAATQAVLTGAQRRPKSTPCCHPGQQGLLARESLTTAALALDREIALGHGVGTTASPREATSAIADSRARRYRSLLPAIALHALNNTVATILQG